MRTGTTVGTPKIKLFGTISLLLLLKNIELLRQIALEYDMIVPPDKL